MRLFKWSFAILAFTAKAQVSLFSLQQQGWRGQTKE